MSKNLLGLIQGLGAAIGLLAMAGCGSVSKGHADGAGGAGGSTVDSGGVGGADASAGGTGGGTDSGADQLTATDGGPADAVGPEAGDGPHDAAADTGPQICDVTRPFGTPVLLGGVNGATGNDDMARLSADELTVYFTSDRSGSNDIWMATRALRTAAFGTPMPVGGLNTTAASEAWPTLTDDGLTIFLESTATAAYQILVATRTTVVAQFSAAAPVANLNVGPIDGQPFVLPDESALYFASSRTGTTGGLDLFRAARAVSGAFGTPAPIPSVNTPSQEYAPTPTSDELVLYFSSNRADAPSKGDFDVWMSQRSSASGSFGPPVNIQELNTAATEWPDWLSPDRCRIYFTRRESTGRKVYVAERAM